MIDAENMRRLAQKTTKHFEKKGSFEELCKYWECLLQIRLAANHGLTATTIHINLSDYNTGFSIDRIVAKLEARGFKVEVEPWIDELPDEVEVEDEDTFENEDFDLVISWNE